MDWLEASMRPPLIAGENARPTACAAGAWGCFNEAPADCGGKPRLLRRGIVLVAPASMRPPLIAGENSAGINGGFIAQLASMRPPLIAGENISVQTFVINR